MQPSKHRTWAEIDLGAIEHNYRVICAHAKAPVLCVVKADAYGHGAVPVAKRLQTMGAPYFAAATVPEAVELRENGHHKADPDPRLCGCSGYGRYCALSYHRAGL